MPWMLLLNGLGSAAVTAGKLAFGVTRAAFRAGRKLLKKGLKAVKSGAKLASKVFKTMRGSTAKQMPKVGSDKPVSASYLFIQKRLQNRGVGTAVNPSENPVPDVDIRKSHLFTKEEKI